MRILALDIDGVFANFTDAYAKMLTRRTGITFPGASNEWPTEWYWERAAGVTKDQELEVWQKDILTSKNFWQKLAPLPNAKPAIRILNKMAMQGDTIIFITNRPGLQAKYQTEKWLYAMGMSYPTVIVAADKLPLLRAIGAEFFIDDKPETVLEVALANIPNFHLYLQVAPYNTDRPYPHNVKHVNGILAALADAYGQS